MAEEELLAPGKGVAPSLTTRVALLKADLGPEMNLIRLRSAKLKSGQEGKTHPVRIPEQLIVELIAHAWQFKGPFVFEGRNQRLNNTFDRILIRAGLAVVEKRPSGGSGAIRPMSWGAS